MRKALVLLTSLLILSACAILYELLISTISSYLLGSSILHFSVTIGLFLSFLGVGAWISKFIQNNLLEKFIWIELFLALTGGFSAFILYFGNAWFSHYYLLLFGCVASVATLAGMEIPLVTRLLERTGSLKELIAKVLAFDYLGALVASLAFPLLMLPMLGTMRTAFFTGLINCAVAVLNLIIFKDEINQKRQLYGFTIFVTLLLLGGFVASWRLVSIGENMAYQDRVIYSAQSPYQRLVMTQWNNDTRLFLNGNLQFSSVDEYRYHEMLIHLPMLSVGNHDSILILGGGDGLALREIWQYPEVKGVDLVDLDKKVTDLALYFPKLVELNKNSMTDVRLKIHNTDAFTFLKNNTHRYNVIIVDLPDPSDVPIGKLYSKEFYGLIKQNLAADGVMITQSTSPFLARKPFWCIHETVKQIFPSVIPTQGYVPSFGLWGFQLAFPYPISQKQLLERINPKVAKLTTTKILRFLTPENLANCFIFDADTDKIEGLPINTLDNMQLIDIYSESFKDYN
jgi:spermidine synthase